MPDLVIAPQTERHDGGAKAPNQFPLFSRYASVTSTLAAWNSDSTATRRDRVLFGCKRAQDFAVPWTLLELVRISLWFQFDMLAADILLRLRNRPARAARSCSRRNRAG